MSRAEVSRPRAAARGLFRIPAGGAIVVLGALLLSGCGPEEPSSAGRGETAIDAREVERWAERLARPVAPVPLPTASARSAEITSLRLIDRFEAARVEPAGFAPEDDERVLARFGREDLGGPGGRVRTVVRKLAGTPYRWLELSGFELACEDVRAIRLRARFGAAAEFILSRQPDKPAASVRVAIDAGEGARVYEIATDELVHWRGRLGALWLGVPLREDGADRIELDWLELSAGRPAFPGAAGVRRARVGDELRQAIYLRGASRIAFPDLPASAPWRLALGLATAGEPLTLRITVDDGTETTRLFEEAIVPSDRWRELRVELPEAASGSLDLLIEAEGPADRVALLASPVIYRPRRDPPRVIVYLIDTLGAAHMSLYGYPRPTTPRLTALAEEGVWFVNAFANASRTRESVPSLMTSLHPVSHGVVELFSRLGPEFLTLADAYAGAGFATAAFSTNPNAGPGRGTDQGFDSFFDHVAWNEDSDALRTVPVARVLAWLERHRDRPTFAYVHTAEPHHPYAPPPPWDTLFDPEGIGDDPWFSDVPAAIDAGPASRARLDRVIARYDGEVAFADRMLGALLDPLRERGLLDNTLLAVTSDHGEEFFERGRSRHGQSVNSRLLRIPLVLWGPRYLERPRRIEGRVQLLDLMPTLVELSGLGIEGPLQGASLAGVARGAADRWLAERSLLLTSTAPGLPQLALVEGRWKLNLANPAGSPRLTVELFDLDRDPWESEDLVEMHPGRVRRMMDSLQTIWLGLPRYAAEQGAPVAVSPRQIERLRALGYVQ